MVIHWSDWAGQPYIRIACTQEYYHPWSNNFVGPPDVYQVDSNTEIYYTFEAMKTTCDECKKLSSYKACYESELKYSNSIKNSF